MLEVVAVTWVRVSWGRVLEGVLVSQNLRLSSQISWLLVAEGNEKYGNVTMDGIAGAGGDGTT